MKWLLLFTWLLFGGNLYADDAQFMQWIKDFKAEALKKNISAKTLDSAFKNINEPLEKVIKSDKAQAEFTQTFWSYIQKTITQKRFDNGRKYMTQYAGLFAELQRKYKVQPSYLIAFWAMESNFGENTGSTPIIHALATLAFDARRADFFRAELLEALKILEKEQINPDKFLGSWAGAMGMTQFMPSTFNNYATDGDNDGKRDVWQSVPDALASAANYLTKLHWQENAHWGREVILPANFDYNLTGTNIVKSSDEWQKLGVRNHRGEAINENESESSIITPMGAQGPAFIVYKNFKIIMIWNKSELYALAVGLLSDWLGGRESANLTIPDNPIPISNNDIKFVQETLGNLGYYKGENDGKFGTGTKNAIREFQKSQNMLADGYPSPNFLKFLYGKYNKAN